MGEGLNSPRLTLIRLSREEYLVVVGPLYNTSLLNSPPTTPPTQGTKGKLEAHKIL